MQILKDQDVVILRNRVMDFSSKIGMSVLSQTKLVTAGSELARNMLKYAKGGTVILERVSQGGKPGIRLIFQDKGPGIPDIKEAMRDGFSTGKSLGVGLPGAKRLVNEFDIKSKPGEGTTVTIIRWKNAI